MLRKVTTVAAGTLLLCWMGLASVSAQSTSSAGGDAILKIELNAASQQQDACRLSFLVANKLGQRVTKLVFELVVFGRDGRVLRLLSASAGSMPLAKTRLKQYDVAGLNCDQIGRVLLNDVMACDGEKLTPETCTAAARTSSRAKIPFDF